jgi:choline monooxygenase
VTAAYPSASDYTDPERYETERRAVFAHNWIAIGDAARVESPGAYLALEVAGYPLVVVNDNGVRRGFLNICRHRAGPLVWPGEGTCRSLVCRYHGWAYGLDGALVSARDFDSAPSAVSEDEDLALVPVTVATWRGLLFVSLDPGAPDLTEWLGIIPERTAGFPMEEFVAIERSGHDIAANWKTYAENYQEGYHIPLVHPGLHRQVESSRYRVELTGAVAEHTAPTRDGSVTAGAWLWRFPGLALNLYPSGMCLESFWPTGPTTTRVEYTFFFLPGTPEEEVRSAVEGSGTILEEDRIICEAVQRNLASGLARLGPLSPKHEGGVALVRALVDQAVADDHPDGAAGPTQVRSVGVPGR